MEALTAAIKLRWQLEELQRDREKVRSLQAQIELLQTSIRQREQRLLSTADGIAYLPEVLLGGNKPVGWTG